MGRLAILLAFGACAYSPAFTDSCPSTNCDDGIPCTLDEIDPVTCSCTNTPIVEASSGDGCCPADTSFEEDQDCSSTCGNGTVEANESCDTAIADGMPGACPTSCDDGLACTSDMLVSAGTCQATCSHTAMQPCATAFRITAFTLQDPHPFVNAGGCSDVRNVANMAQQNLMNGDGNNDGLFDDSLVIVFRPLSQAGGTTTPASLYFGARCTTNATTCRPGTIPTANLTATSLDSGTCLAPLAGTTRPYTPAVTNATGPCFSTEAADVTASVFGANVDVQSLQIAATYMGSPAIGMMNGLLAAFLTQTEAASTNIQISVISGSIASFLPGGNGNCANFSDRDTLGGTQGWWVYYNFTATEVPWTEP